MATGVAVAAESDRSVHSQLFIHAAFLAQDTTTYGILLHTAYYSLSWNDQQGGKKVFHKFCIEFSILVLSRHSIVSFQV